MTDPTRIYLQPECCADPDTGRMWASKPDHECEHGVAWSVFAGGEPVGWQAEVKQGGWSRIAPRGALDMKHPTATGRIRPVYAGEPIDVSEEPTP